MQLNWNMEQIVGKLYVAHMTGVPFKFIRVYLGRKMGRSFSFVALAVRHCTRQPESDYNCRLIISVLQP